MAENRKLKVFLCHSKDDKAQIRKLYHRLIADGFDAWLDEEKLMPGQHWDLEIRKALRETDMVIACLSNNSVTKTGYLQKEIRFALDIADEQPEGKTFMIPARLEDCSVPERLRHLQWVDLFERHGYRKLTESLHRQMDYLNIRFDSNEVLPKTAKDSLRIPIIGLIAAELPLPELKSMINYMTDNEANTVEITRDLLPTKLKGDDLFALEVQGESMNDAMLEDGDVVVLKPATNARNGELVAVWLPRDHTATLKFFFEEKHRYRLQPANPTMKPIFVKKSEPLEIKGKVVMVIRRAEPS
jgi:SOS-response transcriptional repressor LexA